LLDVDFSPLASELCGSNFTWIDNFCHAAVLGTSERFDGLLSCELPSPIRISTQRPGATLTSVNAASTWLDNGIASRLILREGHVTRNPIARVRKLSPNEQLDITDSLSDVVHYRKSGLSLNHIIGCPLDCAYCIRHGDGNWDMKIPHALMSDDDAVRTLVTHRHFAPDRTPIQLFNKATDPLLPAVKPHTFAVLQRLDSLGLTNHVLVISRFHITADDCRVLNSLTSIRLTLLFTYSGIDDKALEPVNSQIAANSLRLAYREAARYRTVLYWRPLIPGVNDSDIDIDRAVELSASAHATVFTGLFFRGAISEYFKARGLQIPYDGTARRKILPQQIDERVTRAFAEAGCHTLFRKTSCGVAYAHRTHDYNGHYGIRELCDICPRDQVKRCAAAFERPTRMSTSELLNNLGRHEVTFTIDDRAVTTTDLDDPDRYYLQHALGYQVHHHLQPHHHGRHGRAEIGWPAT
jgi:DNA repair photolyase